MALYKSGELAFAKFAGYPLWPVRIIDSMKIISGGWKYLVYCYGSQDQQTVAEISLLNFESNKNEALK